MVRDELALEDLVRHWAAEMLPGEVGVAERAANIALVSYASGASVDEACGEARIFVEGWARHPSHHPVPPAPSLWCVREGRTRGGSRAAQLTPLADPAR